MAAKIGRASVAQLDLGPAVPTNASPTRSTNRLIESREFSIAILPLSTPPRSDQASSGIAYGSASASVLRYRSHIHRPAAWSLAASAGACPSPPTLTRSLYCSPISTSPDVFRADVKNDRIDALPSVVHFGGFEVNQTHTFTLVSHSPPPPPPCLTTRFSGGPRQSRREESYQTTVTGNRSFTPAPTPTFHPPRPPLFSDRPTPTAT